MVRLNYLLGIKDTLQEDIYLLSCIHYNRDCRRRYLFRELSYKCRETIRNEKLESFLHTDYYTDTEFKEHFRLSREMFWATMDRIKNDPAFWDTPGKRKKFTIELHLLVLLKYLGSNGNEASISKLGMFFHISKGAFKNCLKRIVSVLLKNLDDAVFWPEADERKEISTRIKSKYKFPNCVGLIDGTLFPLELKPTKNGEDYFCRKSCYAVHALITCDDTARIQDLVIGWPGSVHDNRVWTTSCLYSNRFTKFGTKEYLLGDSAFQESLHMVPAFKKP